MAAFLCHGNSIPSHGIVFLHSTNSFCLVSVSFEQFLHGAPFTRFWPVSPFLPVLVPRPWFCPVFHGVCPVSSVRPSDPFFARDPWYTFFPRVAVRGSVCASTMVLPCFSWRGSSFVLTAVGTVFLPVNGYIRFWPVSPYMDLHLP